MGGCVVIGRCLFYFGKFVDWLCSVFLLVSHIVVFGFDHYD